MLKEPEKRITNDAIIFVICVSGASNKTEIQVLIRYFYLKAPCLCPSCCLSITFSHGTGNPVKFYIFSQATKGSDHAATATARVKLPILRKIIFDRPPIASQN